MISDFSALEDFKGLILNIVPLDGDLVFPDVDCYTTVQAFLCSSSPTLPWDVIMIFEEWNSK